MLMLVLVIIPLVVGEFTSVPTTVKTYENDTVLLPCYLDGIGTEETGGEPIAIRWYKDNALIANSDNPISSIDPDRIKIWPNGSLEASAVKYDDTGEYMCEVVRNPPWGSITQIHAIEVLYPPTVEMTPNSGLIQVRLGEEVHISCTASGVPAPLIMWKSDGKEIQLLNNRRTLIFDATDKTLTGEYECVASNGVGTPASAKTQVIIIYPPEITVNTHWQHTSPGLRASLDCMVSADPPAEVTWYKGDAPVPLDTRVVTLSDHDRHSLIIRNVRISDFGIYKCKAVNDVGEAEVEIQLSGVANPANFKQIEQKIDPERAKNTFTLVWEVDSYSPIIEYNLWFRPYNPYHSISAVDWTKLTIPAEHTSGPMHSKAYTLTGLQEGTVYEAMLFSRNRYGWSKASQVLKFATEGTEIDEEMISQIHVQENLMPIDPNIFRKSVHLYGNAILFISNKLLIFTLLLCIFLRFN